MTLTRFDQRQSAALAVQVAEGRELSQTVVERIIQQTDGVPLFIEEMTKAILEIEPSGSSLARAVPSTLQALLMTRLDRLGLVTKDVAQAGAAIGREFGFGLLAAVTDLPEPQLCESLDRLTSAGLLFVRGAPPGSNYITRPGRHCRGHSAAVRQPVRLPRDRTSDDKRRRRSGTGLAGARSERDQQPFRGTLFGQFDATRRPRGGADVAVTCLAAGQIR